MDSRPERIAALAAIVCGLIASPEAQAAASASATMSVSVEVVPNCTVAAEPLAFGSVSVNQAPGREATASIEVACGPQTPFAVTLDDGLNPDNGTRRARDPATGQYLSYDIYLDAAHSQRWGLQQSQSASAVTTATGTATLTAYGLIGGETQAAAGRYDDQVTVTTHF